MQQMKDAFPEHIAELLVMRTMAIGIEGVVRDLPDADLP
jgi:hypothetical protein